MRDWRDDAGRGSGGHRQDEASGTGDLARAADGCSCCQPAVRRIEQSLPFGVVRQLFEGAIADAPGDGGRAAPWPARVRRRTSAAERRGTGGRGVTACHRRVTQDRYRVTVDWQRYREHDRGAIGAQVQQVLSLGTNRPSLSVSWWGQGGGILQWVAMRGESSPGTWCKTSRLISSVTTLGAHAAASSATSS